MNIDGFSLSFEQLKHVVDSALEELYQNDRFLLDFGIEHYGTEERGLLQKHAGERSIMFRFAYYLQNALSSQGYIVDCEYNRHIYNVKTLGRKAIVPDVIIHERGRNDHNLLAIELKPWWNPKREYDVRKLKGLTGQRYDYQYRYGLWLLLGKHRNETRVEWYRDGKILREDE